MIVIATHKNPAEELVQSIKKHTPNEKYLIIDSVGVGGYFPYSFYRGMQVEAGEYIFLHDSMLVKDNKWLQRFRDKDTGGIVAHSTFSMCYDNSDQESYSKSIASGGEMGVFGCIFYAKKQVVGKLKPFFNHEAKNVIEARGWERILGSICYQENIPISSVYGEFNHKAVEKDQLEGLTKYFLLRS